MKNRLGWKPSPPKEPGQKPDWSATRILKAVEPPKAASAKDLILNILDQGNLPTCVLNAVMQNIRACHVEQGIVNPVLGSRLFGYKLAMASQGNPVEPEGTDYRTVFEALAKLGFPAESAWPYRTGSDDKDRPYWSLMPDTMAFVLANKQKTALTYHRILGSGPERKLGIQQAISQRPRHLVLFGAQVSNQFCYNEYKGKLVPLPSWGDIAGGHALIAAGYDEDGVDVPNSWADDWGDDGWCRFSWEYLLSEFCDDFWIVEHAAYFAKAA